MVDGRNHLNLGRVYYIIGDAMIEIIKRLPSSTHQRVKAVGLLSGGLDSTLAAKIIHAQGIEVHALYFSMPWGCCDKTKAMEVADHLGIKLVILQLDERYLEVIKNPQHGYGTAMNPCRDCRIHMFSRAQRYMESIGADFVFTGEVLGQRPMSQLRASMSIIERESHLEGRLLRPLCAQLMEPTIPEREGVVDRQKLLNISGRSRREQMLLAQELGIKDYLPPAGGCLLTDQNFASRMKDTLKYGYRNFRETISLKWGRHFRISKDFKAILGRDEAENQSLKAFAHKDDLILEFIDKQGPTLLLKGYNIDANIIATAAGLLQRFSKYKDEASLEVGYRSVQDMDIVRSVPSRVLTEEEIERMRI